MFKHIKYRSEIFKTLMYCAKGERRFLLVLLLASMLAVIIQLFLPQYYKIFIDDVIVSGEIKKLSIVVNGYLLLFLAEVSLGYIKYLSNLKLSNFVIFNVRKKILANFLTKPFNEYESTSVGDMKMCIDDDTNQMNDFFCKQIIEYLFAYLTLIISTCILFIIEWRLAIFSIISIPLTFGIDNLVSCGEKRINKVKRENCQDMSSWLHTSIHGWREIKALNLYKYELKKFYNYSHVNMLCNAKWINFRTARLLVIPKIKNKVLMQCGLYFLGGFIIISGEFRIGELLVFVMYYELLSNAVNTISSADSELHANMPFTDRLLKNIKYQNDIKQVGGIIPNDSNLISIKSVSFVYPNAEKYVLQNFSLEIKKGERVALIGKSGCGKTTILKLILGMIKPTIGEVAFCGINLDEIDLSAMHNRFGYIMQENILFNTSIRENLLYGKQDATDKELLEACKKSCILEFVENLHDGIDTIIGENGIKLSGGQRQRLVLARLFLRDVEIFIFDEATSALDQYNENLICDVIQNIESEKTVIVVSHREHSVKFCERKIFV